MQLRRILPLLGATLGLALVAAGCGGGSGSPPVANVAGGATTTTGEPSGSAPSRSTSGGGGGGGFGLTLKTQNGLKFAQCMRAHGVANFPDPSSNGTLQIGPSSGIDPRTSAFQSAQRACQKLLGTGKPPSPAELAKAKQQALAFSACMRRHGLPDFPDPDFSNGGIGIRIRVGGNLNPSSPTFQAAQRACRGILPAKGGP